MPDADDTSGALVALHVLTGGTYSEEVGKGVEWLLALQNEDGGMPTFCKGWGKLPFDRSSPDISAHSLLAFELWLDALPKELRLNAGGVSVGYWVGCGRFSHRMVHGLLYGLETKMRRMSVLLFMVRRWQWNICRLPGIHWLGSWQRMVSGIF